MKSLTLLLLTCFVAVPFADRPIRVHVVPIVVAEGFVDVDSKRRVDSRADFIKHLQGEKTLVLVESAAAADVVIDILGSRHEPTGEIRTTTTATPVLGGAVSTSTADMSPTITAKLSAGAYEKDFRAQLSTISWRQVAGILNLQIRKWIKENKAQLLAKNPQ